MGEIRVDSIRGLLDDNQVLLCDVVQTLTVLRQLPLPQFMRIMIITSYTKYILDFGHICSEKNEADIFRKAMKRSGCDFIDIGIIKNEEMRAKENKELFVKFKMYNLFYYKLWPELVKAIENSMSSKNKIKFKYNIPYTFVKDVYDNNVKLFKNELFGLFKLNGLEGNSFDVEGINNVNTYTIEVEI